MKRSKQGSGVKELFAGDEEEEHLPSLPEIELGADQVEPLYELLEEMDVSEDESLLDDELADKEEPEEVEPFLDLSSPEPVSYTHLTLPTIYSV